MTKKSYVQESLFLYEEKKEIHLFRWKLINKNEILVLERPSKNSHYHFFMQNGKPVCQITIEGKKKKHILTNKKWSDLYDKIET